MSIIFSDACLSKMWSKFEFEKISRKLLFLQQKLTDVAKYDMTKELENLQNKIINDIEIKALAVYKVTVEHNPGPGIDGILWTSDAEKMKGAIDLRSDDYCAKPFRRIIIEDKAKMKKRYIGIPTVKDRAMQMLYSFVLDPIAEAKSDKKSFAFRRGRSALDAHYFISKALMYPNSPEWIFVGDIKSCYGSISHDWLLKNVPINKHVLKEFLKSGFIFDKKLFPTEQGITLGSSISPILGNMVLNGLQTYIYKFQKDFDNFDYSNGDMIRYADDIIVIAKSKKCAYKIKERVEMFLSERGLKLSQEKSKIVNISEGFDFLSRHYCKINGIFSVTPSEKAVKAFEINLNDYILKRGKNMSGRGLIKGLNAKLQGWSSYHRIEESLDVFRHLDVFVSSLLLKLMQKLYPSRTKEYLISKFWYEEANGRKVYSLVNRRDIKVYRMADTVLINHNPLCLAKNPYLDYKYFEEKLENQDIDNVNGKYKSIWIRQSGKCFYCGNYIDVCDTKEIIHINSLNDNSLANLAYIHQKCKGNEAEFIYTNIDSPDNIDVMNIICDIKNNDKKVKSCHKFKVTSKYDSLEKYFRNKTERKFSLSFNQIEKILGFKLSNTAYKNSSFWYSNSEESIAYTWKLSGFEVSKIEFKNSRVYFHRIENYTSKLTVPPALLKDNIPNEAKFELDKFFSYIIKKYGL